MISRLHQTNLYAPGACSLGFTEDAFSVKDNGLSYDFTIRDKIAVEHIHYILSNALAFQIQTGSSFPATVPPRKVREYIIRSLSVV